MLISGTEDAVLITYDVRELRLKDKVKIASVTFVSEMGTFFYGEFSDYDIADILSIDRNNIIVSTNLILNPKKKIIDISYDEEKYGSTAIVKGNISFMMKQLKKWFRRITEVTGKQKIVLIGVSRHSYHIMDYLNNFSILDHSKWDLLDIHTILRIKKGIGDTSIRELIDSGALDDVIKSNCDYFRRMLSNINGCYMNDQLEEKMKESSLTSAVAILVLVTKDYFS